MPTSNKDRIAQHERLTARLSHVTERWEVERITRRLKLLERRIKQLRRQERSILI